MGSNLRDGASYNAAKSDVQPYQREVRTCGFLDKYGAVTWGIAAESG
jgi:hypothetical protein